MSLIELGAIRIDLDRHTVEREGVREHLTTLEAEVLRYLLEAGGPVSREDLMSEVWGYAGSTLSRTCDTTIRRLRVKIEEDPSRPQFLLSVHGLGYRLRLPGAAPVAPLPAPVASEGRYALGDHVIDLDRGQLETPRGATPLTRTESVLLRVLLEAGGEALDRDTLQRRVWGSALGQPLKIAISRLRRKLELDPASPRLLLTTAHGYRLAIPHTATERSPLRPPLPAEVDRRFGGDLWVEAVLRSLEQGDRLVTLTGPAGIGKTRLALAAAVRWRASGRDVLWVDARAARTAEALCAAIALALQAQVAGPDLLGALIRMLAPEGERALVLDNLEQVEEGGATLGALLAGAPRLRVVVTSRVLLRARGERVLRIEPLPREHAAELFLDRAVRRPPDAERAEILALVDELEGLPLSIELAAARTALLSVAQIRQRTGEALRLLSSAALPDRAGSLRASLDTSWTLLSSAAQGVLAQLTVFESTFSLEAALEVLDPSSPEWLVDLVQELMDASLLRLGGEQGRLSLFVVVREYAREHLAPAAREAAEERHGRFYARSGGEHTEDALYGPRRHDLLARLELDLPEIRSALERALARADLAVVVGTLRAAWPLWFIHGPYALVARLVDQALELPLEPGARAEVELMAGALDISLGGEAEPHLQTARAFAREVGDTALEARATHELGRLHLQRGRVAEAQEALDEAVALAKRSGSWSIECRVLILRGILQRELGPALLPEIFAEAERIALTHGSSSLVARVTNRLATHAVRQGRLEDAAQLYTRGRTLARDDRDPLEEATLLYDVGVLHFQRGEIHKALSDWIQAETAHRWIGKTTSQGMALLAIAGAHTELGAFDEAEAASLRALELFRGCDARIDVIYALIGLGLLASTRTDGRADPAAALRCFREALDLALASGDRHREGYARAMLGQLVWVCGDDEGLRELEDAVDTFASLEHPAQWCMALVLLGRALDDAGQLEAARDRGQQALSLAQRLRHVNWIEEASCLLASVEARSGQPDAARARLASRRSDPFLRSPEHEARLHLVEAELAHARGDTPGRRAALEAASGLFPPLLLGRRFRALQA